MICIWERVLSIEWNGSEIVVAMGPITNSHEERYQNLVLLKRQCKDCTAGQLPFPSVSTHVCEISEKGAQIYPKPRT